MSFFEQFRNPGKDTYNGVRMLAALTGLPEAEVAWTAKRVQQLIREGKSKDVARAVVREEVKGKPWEQSA